MEQGHEIAEVPSPEALRNENEHSKAKAQRIESGRHSNIIGVHLILQDESRVLLGRRLNTTFGQGQYHVPAGHLEAQFGESLSDCAVREAAEELGITVDPAHLTLAHVMHQHDLNDGRDRIGVFFVVRAWTGQIINAEPHKCAGWEWHSYDRLPDQLVDYTRTALVAIQSGVPYSEIGWPVYASGRPEGSDEVGRSHVR